MAHKDFIHPTINSEIVSIAGLYMYQQEIRLPFRGKDLLYLTGYYIIDTSCCGTGGCVFATIPGYIVKWHYRQTEEGAPVSLVESIDNRETRSEIVSIIRQREISQQFNFV